MKRLLLAGVALAALAVGVPAMAADLPVYQEPIIAPIYDWTGFYVGVNGGYSWGKSATNFNLAGFPPFSGKLTMAGGLLGGQGGYNWQVNPNFIVGIEADLQGARQNGTLNDAAGPFCSTTTAGIVTTTTCTSGSASLEQTLRWFGTGRLRLGVLATSHLMFYATGGVAFGQIQNSVSINTSTTTMLSIGPNPFASTTTSAINAATSNTNRVGWVAGGGTEYVLSGPWTAKVEYLFVDYGSFSNTYTLVGVPALTTSSHVRDNIVRVGLNYRFGGPVVARY
jgi:outer membrane immunogenic protein